MKIFNIALLTFLFMSSASYAVTEKMGETIVYTQTGAVSAVLEHETLYDYPKCFASVDFFNSGGVRVSPSAGTVTITVKTKNTAEFVSVANNAIDATALTVPDWFGNTVAVRATPSGIVGAVNYRLVASCNRY